MLLFCWSRSDNLTIVLHFSCSVESVSPLGYNNAESIVYPGGDVMNEEPVTEKTEDTVLEEDHEIANMDESDFIFLLIESRIV